MAVGKGLARSSFIQTRRRLRMRLSKACGTRAFPAGMVGLEPERTFPAGSHHPWQAPGEQECSCREHSQLRARLVTNVSVSPVTGGSEPFGAGVSPSLLCSFPIFSFALQLLPSSPVFLSPSKHSDAASNSFRPKIPQPTGTGRSSLLTPARGDAHRGDPGSHLPLPELPPHFEAGISRNREDFATECGEGSLANAPRLLPHPSPSILHYPSIPLRAEKRGSGRAPAGAAAPGPLHLSRGSSRPVLARYSAQEPKKGM